MTMLSRAVVAHSKALLRTSGVDVLILRGPRTSLAIKAVPATSTHIIDGGGDNEGRPVPMKLKMFDWIFITADLATACADFPEFRELLSGDVIERQSDKKKFQVQGAQPGRPANEPHDAHGVMVVTHSLEG